MAPPRKTTEPRSYGRQATNKTIKSLSMSTEAVQWAEAKALEAGISFSSFIEAMLAQERSRVNKEEHSPPQPTTALQGETYRQALKKKRRIQ